VSGAIDFSTATYISEEDHYKFSQRSKVDKGDILLAMIGTIGNPVLVDTDEEFSVKNVALFKFRDSQVYNRYFRHLLDSDIILRQMMSAIRGGTQKFVSLKVLRNLQIPLPPLAEQQRIAAILDQADALRTKRRAALAKLDTLLQATFLDMFGDPVTNPMGWEVVKLSEISDVDNGVTKSSGRIRDKKTVTLPYMRVANVQDGKILTGIEDVKFIEILLEDAEKYLLRSGDILLTEGGDPDKLGRGGIWKGEIDPCIHQNHIFRVRISDNNFLPEYLSALIGSWYGKKYFLKAAKQTTGIATINKTQLQAFPVQRANIDIQYKFSQFVKKLETQKLVLETNSNDFTNLFHALQQRAFQGEL